MDTQSLLSRLGDIDQTLAVVPREGETQATTRAPAQEPAYAVTQRAVNNFQGISQSVPGRAQYQLLPDMHGKFPVTANKDAGATSLQTASTEATAPQMNAPKSAAQPEGKSQKSEPALDVLASQMEQQSVQLMQHVAMAVANMPEQSVDKASQQSEVAGSGLQQQPATCTQPAVALMDGNPIGHSTDANLALDEQLIFLRKLA